MLSRTQVSSASAAVSTPRMKPLEEDFRPGAFDVICAKGKDAYNHEGNKRFRTMIRAHIDMYSIATGRTEKSSIVSHIVDTVRRASPEGGFVRFYKGRWYEVDQGAARDKVGQSFREWLHTKYRSSTKAKRRRQREISSKAQQQQQGQDHNEQSDHQKERDLAVSKSSTSTTTSNRTVVVENWHRGVELHKFEQQQGQSRVPAPHEARLGEWVDAQCLLQQVGKLNKSQEAHLDALGTKACDRLLPTAPTSDSASTSDCSSSSRSSSSSDLSIAGHVTENESEPHKADDYLQAAEGLASLMNSAPAPPRAAAAALATSALLPTLSARVQPALSNPTHYARPETVPLLSADLTAGAVKQIAIAQTALSVARALILANL